MCCKVAKPMSLRLKLSLLFIIPIELDLSGPKTPVSISSIEEESDIF